MGLALNLFACGIFIGLYWNKVLGFAGPWIFVAFAFSLGSIVFLLLLIIRPQSTINIDRDKISKSGLFGAQSMNFSDVSEARLLPDPDAKNYNCLILSSKKHNVLVIDPRFLNPDVDGIITCLMQNGVNIIKSN